MLLLLLLVMPRSAWASVVQVSAAQLPVDGRSKPLFQLLDQSPRMVESSDAKNWPTQAAILGGFACALSLAAGLYWWTGYAFFFFLAAVHAFFAALVWAFWMGSDWAAAGAPLLVKDHGLSSFALGFAICYVWFVYLANRRPADPARKVPLPVILTSALLSGALVSVVFSPVQSVLFILGAAWLCCAVTLIYSWTAWKIHVRHSSPLLCTHLFFLVTLLAQGLFALEWAEGPMEEVTWSGVLVAVFFVHAFLVSAVGIDNGKPPQGEGVKSEHTELEAQAKRQIEELRTASENSDRVAALQRDFLATMSHELRTPLASMIGLCRMLSNAVDLPSSTKRDMGTIERLGVQLLRMVDDGLAYVRQRGEEVSTCLSSVNMRNLLRDIESVSHWLAQQQGNQFQMSRVHEIPSTLLFDERRMRQILINLISNAGRYCRNGQIGLKIRFLSHKGKHELHWTVSDTGRGMKPDELQHMFEPFAKSRDSQGLGLGLAVVKRLTDELDGSLKVSSKPNHGTQFVVTIPVSSFTQDFVDTDPSNWFGNKHSEAQNSIPMGFFQPHELKALQLDRLRSLAKLGQVTDIEDWVREVLARKALSPEATRFAQKVRDAIREVDLALIESYIDQLDSPASLV